MEEDYELEESKKGSGWYNKTRADSIRHGLSARGIRNAKNKVDRRYEKARELSDADELDWGKFVEIYGGDAETMLEELINKRKAEVDSFEVEDPSSRLRYGETRLEITDGDDFKVCSIDKNSPIKLLGEPSVSY